VKPGRANLSSIGSLLLDATSARPASSSLNSTQVSDIWSRFAPTSEDEPSRKPTRAQRTCEIQRGPCAKASKSRESGGSVGNHNSQHLFTLSSQDEGSWGPLQCCHHLRSMMMPLHWNAEQTSSLSSSISGDKSYTNLCLLLVASVALNT
jgi:hypothetical protein